ncbi:putative phage abortive infection protein [Pseudomonas sp. Irchel 3H9]|uniref:putative phage abortive infection protein n=1 Tax=Pseudomonas sp. Irchel 3H9 TaxID=2009043 RepID=UPI000BA2FA7E|nr:putative phage abortive infection protein [Pseudomonas sp. Irchel 3H9]
MDLGSVNVDRVVKFALYSFFLIVPLTVLFLWKIDLDTSLQIDSAKFGTFGDFIGGVLGSIWSLCGVLIFYIALKEQRDDFKTNKDAFVKQAEALDLQIEEFRLQRDELYQSRQVFIEQSRTLKQQRMSSMYFSLIDLYRKIVDGLNEQCAEGNYFKTLRRSMLDDFVWCVNPDSCHKKAKEHYVTLYYSRKEELSHYYKIIYRIFKVVDESDLDESDKFQYITILRSQLSENEMLAIYYNSQSRYGEQLYRFILRYNFLKHLPSISKPEFKGYLTGQINFSDLLGFNTTLFSVISEVIQKLEVSIRGEDFEEEKVSFSIIEQNNITLSVRASELNEMQIDFSYPLPSSEMQILNFNVEDFSSYMSFLLYDFFVCSRYQNEPFSDFVKVCVGENDVSFIIVSQNILRLNGDADGVKNV